MAGSPTNGSGPKDNFMNKVTLGTYKFTLFLVDQEVWNNPRGFLAGRAAFAPGKSVIIAESGVEGGYMLENVVITTEAANATNGNADVLAMEFSILEPLGFNLLDRVLTVGMQLNRGDSSGSINFTSLKYVLKLEFLGRDPVTGATRFYEEEFLYSGDITNVNATIGPGGTDYHCVFSPKEILVILDSQNDASITVRDVDTVRAYASGLETALNDYQRSIMQSPPQEKPFIEWVVKLGDRVNIAARDAPSIRGFDFANAPWAGLASTSTSGGQAQMLNGNTANQTSINAHSQLISSIEQTIVANTPTFAEWSREARRQGVLEEIIVLLDQEDLEEIDPLLRRPRRKNTITINLRADPTISIEDNQDFISLATNAGLQNSRFDSEIFPFLIKKYSYLYTGENTEVMDIELNINQLFQSAQSPAAGIYYANNRNQFEPNIIEPTRQSGQTGGGADSSQTANPPSARYLSDVELGKINILQSQVFGVAQRSSQSQQVNETTTTDTIASAAIQEYAKRVADSHEITISARGDPIFLGQTGSGNNLFDGSASSVFAAVLSYTPDPEDLLIDQVRGPVNMVLTGIYKITRIESKFQNGSFTQRVNLLRDPNSTTFLLLQRIIELELQ
jgi:hypothetical protein